MNLAPDDVHNPSALRLLHPFVGYDQAPAQVGDDDGPARVRGRTPASCVFDDFDMSEAALQKLVAANPVTAALVFQEAVEYVVKQIINIHLARKTNLLICGSDKGIKDSHKP